jgi:hypothetical protein
MLFLAVAASDNPLKEAVRHRDVWAGLKRMVRIRWPRKHREGRTSAESLRDLDWDQLDAPEQEQIREMARHLAGYHRSHVRRGRPSKGDLDALMGGLADNFVSATGSNRGRVDVPYNEDSRFIQFATAALSPLSGKGLPFAIWEVTPDALSRRRERVVGPARKARAALDAEAAAPSDKEPPP